ncbi:MAG: phosphatase PAP2 family protein [Tumebacillaceae bacterium]
MSQTDILIWIQSFATPWLDRLMMAFSFIGDEEFYLAMVPLIFLGVHKRIGIRLAVVMALSVFANEAVKFAVAQPRPIGVPGVRNLYTSSAPGYSFPSGHSQSSATFWGYLACWVQKKWFFALAFAVVLTIMFSRLYLGVHWPLDVAAGLTFGGLIISAIFWLESTFYKQPLAFWTKLLPGLVLPVPLLWLYHEPEGLKMTGFLLGCWVGYVIECRTVGMQLPKRWVKRILPALLGAAAVFVIRSVLKDLVPPGAPWDLLRYTLVGLGGTLLMPWVLVKLGWYPIENK